MLFIIDNKTYRKASNILTRRLHQKYDRNGIKLLVSREIITRLLGLDVNVIGYILCLLVNNPQQYWENITITQSLLFDSPLPTAVTTTVTTLLC